MRMMSETEIVSPNLKFSCTVVIDEAVLLFGGNFQVRQISQLNPFGLVRIGTLPFSFIRGTCLVMDRQLFLGFPYRQYQSCWSRLAALNSESCEIFI